MQPEKIVVVLKKFVLQKKVVELKKLNVIGLVKLFKKLQKNLIFGFNLVKIQKEKKNVLFTKHVLEKNVLIIKELVNGLLKLFL